MVLTPIGAYTVDIMPSRSAEVMAAIAYVSVPSKGMLSMTDVVCVLYLHQGSPITVTHAHICVDYTICRNHRRRCDQQYRRHLGVVRIFVRISWSFSGVD